MRPNVKVTSSPKAKLGDIQMFNEVNLNSLTDNFTITFPATWSGDTTSLSVYMPDGVVLKLQCAQFAFQ
jgi:hypothetical protein